MTEENYTPEYKESFKMKLNYWLLDNREFFRKMGVTAFIVFDIFLISLIVIFYAVYFSNLKKQNNIINNLAHQESNLESWINQGAPRSLLIKKTDYVRSGNNIYDFVVQVENRNKYWFLESLEYKFVWSGGESEIEKSFVLPEETKYLLILKQEFPRSVSNPSLQIVNQSWKWIGKSFYSDVMNKSKLVTTEAEYVSGGDNILDRSRYTVKNDTIYNFWEMNFNVILYQESEIVGLNRGYTQKFYSGESVSLENVWFDRLHGSIDVVIDPEVNFLDSNIYVPTETGGEVK